MYSTESTAVLYDIYIDTHIHNIHSKMNLYQDIKLIVYISAWVCVLENSVIIMLFDVNNKYIFFSIFYIPGLITLY